jgi:uncharacterized protein YcfJ
LWNLVLLGAIQIFIGFQHPMIDNAAHIGGMLGGAAIALIVAPGGLIGRSKPARLGLIAVALAFLAGFGWAGLAVARTSLERTVVERIPQKLDSAGDRTWRVPQYWERDADKDVVYDPFLVADGLMLPAHGPPKDPVLGRLLERIAKNAPSP